MKMSWLGGALLFLAASCGSSDDGSAALDAGADAGGGLDTCTGDCSTMNPVNQKVQTLTISKGETP